MASAPIRIRWDRLGRIALLFVVALVLYLYIGPTAAWVTTYRESRSRKAELAALERTNQRLRARRDELRRPGTLEAEARSLGMVRGGAKAYVVTGLPGR
ncbi:MAG: FtsB family cell division protein [Solirubrobacteraceae bacterium]